MLGGRVEQCLAQAFVDLDHMHVADPLGEELREHPQATADLQRDVRPIEFAGPLDHAEDVRVDQEVLTEVSIRAYRETPQTAQAGLDRRLGHGAHSHANSRAALRCTASPRSSGATPRSSATKASVCATKAGWLRCLRTTCGVR